MSLNTAVHTLYTSKEPWVSYNQIIDLSSPYTDSCYNNHVIFKKDHVELIIPQQIDMIYNLTAYTQEIREIDLFLYSNQSCRKIPTNFLFNDINEPIHIKCKMLPSLKISFTAVLFKKNVREKIQSKL